jgi:hypothetical protein
MRYVRSANLLAVLAAVALLLAASIALAQSSTSFDQGWHVLSGGGAPSGSASFAADGSLGQWAGGAAESSTYRVEGGTWYGPVARAVAGDVNCDCQVDIVDVQLVANMWRCTSGDGCYNAYCDIDASGGIDVIDIMLVAADWGACCS